jgi:hypothetical protein
MSTRKALPVLLGLALCVAGCAQRGSPPHAQWDAADALLLRAQTAGATQVPAARLHVLLAVADLQQAQSLMGLDNSRATTLCEAAAAEARLAESLTRNPRAMQSAPAGSSALQSAP